MISVVIPAYQNAIEVMTCLNSLRAYADRAHQYLVQDDCSPSVNFCAVVPPEIADTERNPINLGFAGNVNAGVRRAVCQYVAMVNQNVFAVEQFSRGWDTAILQAFADPAVGIVAPRLLFQDGAIQSVGGIVDGARQPVHRCLGWRNLAHPDISEPRDVTWATGAFLVIRRSIFEALGGLDTAYRMYWEDADLCFRVREAGWKIRYTPAATFVHQAGSTGGSPHFLASAQLFKSRWVDTGRIEPETSAVTIRYW